MKPLRDILNFWELVTAPNGSIVVRGVTADGGILTTSPVVGISTPQGDKPGWVETKNSFYALGSPKA